MNIETTRDKIKAAATEEFSEKGFGGARMQAIADRAGANKAMIHYYFQTKDALFEAVIRETFEELFNQFSEIRPGGGLDPRKIVPQILNIHMRFLLEHPYIPKIMVRELHSGHPAVAKVLGEMFGNLKQEKLPDLIRVFEAGADAGIIRRVDPLQTVLSMVALNVFYIVAKPFLNAGWPEVFSGQPESRILEARENAVADLILNGLLPREGES
jgi:TetR/AcrR family transcriptional regulator